MTGTRSQLPPGPFTTILVDPPWCLVAWSAKGEGKSPQRHYNCLAPADIASLPVGDLAARHSALFLWVPWPMMNQANTIIEAWGFRYSGLAWTWVKFNPATGKYAFGPGYGTRKNCEPCLLARRGQPKVKSRSVRDLIFAPRREHSRKPDEQYARIEALFDGPYLELFSRASPRPGWTHWGDELGKFEP